MKTKPRSVFDRLSQMDHRKLDEVFHESHEMVFESFDCLSCANCCKSIPPILREADIRRISAYLRIKPSDFYLKYVKYDEDGDMVMNISPCPFLEADNTCRIYSHRPLACAEYPHTNRARMFQILKLTQKNVNVCPAVREILKLIENIFLATQSKKS